MVINPPDKEFSHIYPFHTSTAIPPPKYTSTMVINPPDKEFSHIYPFHTSTAIPPPKYTSTNEEVREIQELFIAAATENKIVAKSNSKEELKRLQDDLRKQGYRKVFSK